MQMPAPILGPAVPIPGPVIKIELHPISRTLGNLHLHESADFIEEEKRIATEIIEEAKFQGTIGIDEAEKLIEKINQGSNVLNKENYDQVELIAQRLDLELRLKDKANDIFETYPSAKKDIEKRISTFEKAAEKGDLKESTDAIIDLDIGLNEWDKKKKYYEWTKSWVEHKIAKAAEKIVPPPPPEVEILPPPPPGRDEPPRPIGYKGPIKDAKSPELLPENPKIAPPPPPTEDEPPRPINYNKKSN